MREVVEGGLKERLTSSGLHPKSMRNPDAEFPFTSCSGMAAKDLERSLTKRSMFVKLVG